jgi:hypothetical protein
MPLKIHKVTRKDYVYDLLGDILQGINEVITSLEVDE